MLRLTPPVPDETGRRGPTASSSSTSSSTHRARSAQARHRSAQARQLSSRARPESLSPADLGLGQLFVHTREAIVVGNVETGRIVLWNPAAVRVFGYTPDEAIGQPIHMLLPPAIAHLHTTGLEHYARTGHGRLVESGTPIEVPAMTRDGQEIRVELTLARLETPLLQTRYVAAIARDVSERKRAELLGLDATRAESARSEAERLLAERTALLNEGIREVRLGVRKLQRTTGRLRRALAGNGGREPLLARVADSRVETLSTRLELLADRAQIQAGSFVLQPERVNLVPLLGRVVADARARSQVHQLRLATPQGLTAAVDSRRIEQVCRLLLQQACQRTPRGCWVDVELRRPLAGLARLEVRDYARPLSAARRARLMQPNGREAWLSVSRYVVEQHGGTLVLEFPPEGGLRVIVTLPTQGGHARARPH